MNIELDTIDINSAEDTPVISLNDDPIVSNESDTKPSVNFGGGIELLMNDKRKSDPSKKGGDIDIDDLNDLENELIDLTN